MSAIPDTVTGSCTLWSSSSILYSLAEYLVLDDGGCLNALLPADFIPSTSDHLFWDWSLESFWVPWDLQSSVAGSLAIDSFGNTSMSPDRWILSSVRPQHIYSHLLVCTLVPWFPFSLSVGDLASVNGIHQWPVIRRWTTMFDLDTSIRIVGHVLVAVCVEDLPDWWHLLYATSLIVPVFMRFQLSWLVPVYVRHFQPLWRSWSIVYLQPCGDHGPLYIFIMEILIYVYCTWRWPHMFYHVSCLFMAIVLLCIRDC